MTKTKELAKELLDELEVTETEALKAQSIELVRRIRKHRKILQKEMKIVKDKDIKVIEFQDKIFEAYAAGDSDALDVVSKELSVLGI